MPLVEINMKKGRSPEYKKTLMECIHRGLIESINRRTTVRELGHRREAKDITEEVYDEGI